MRFTLGLQFQRQLNYTKCRVALFPDVPNNQNRALKKKRGGERKLDSIPRYDPAKIRK